MNIKQKAVRNIPTPLPKRVMWRSMARNMKYAEAMKMEAAEITE